VHHPLFSGKKAVSFAVKTACAEISEGGGVRLNRSEYSGPMTPVGHRPAGNVINQRPGGTQTPGFFVGPVVKGNGMNPLMTSLLIGLAGFAGAVARWLVARLFGQFNIHFPLGTLVINITGSLFLGWFLTHAARHQFSDAARVAIGVGFVGAYTTFSTYMFESNALLDDGAIIKSCLNLFGSLALGLLAVRLGIWLGRLT
jgi:fluoride exporter